MGLEIERKFLVDSDGWKKDKNAIRSVRDIHQGYLANGKDKTVRVRLTRDLDSGIEQAFLTIKGKTQGATVPEFEYEIPFEDGKAMFAMCGDNKLDKTRTEIEFDGMVWEVDQFWGGMCDEANFNGLVLAEVELESENQEVSLPDWLGPEVTNDRRYKNAVLASIGFSPEPRVIKEKGDSYELY